MSSNRVKLLICGTEYPLSSDEPASYMESLGQEVDTFMQDLMNTSPHVSTLMAAVMASITFADEKHKASDSADNLRAQMKEYLDENARLHMQLDSVQRELDTAKRDLGTLRQQHSANSAHHPMGR